MPQAELTLLLWSSIRHRSVCYPSVYPMLLLSARMQQHSPPVGVFAYKMPLQETAPGMQHSPARQEENPQEQ